MTEMYKTGNPVPSNAPKDFSDNAITIDNFINNTEPCTENRFGQDVITLKGLEKKADDAIDGVLKAEKSALDSAERAEVASEAALVGGRLFLTIEEGLEQTEKDELFNVVDSSNDTYVTLYKNDGNGGAIELKKYPSSEAILDKSPFLALVRNGVSSPRHMGFTNFISDISVIGAKEGKYYRVSYFQNGANLSGVRRDSWIIEEIDAATMAENGSFARIISTDTESPEINRDLDNQVIVLTTHRRKDLTFVLAIKPKNLPAEGAAVSSQTITGNGYSWIFNPTKYIPKAKPEPPVQTSNNQVLVAYSNSQKELIVTFDRDSEYQMRITLKPNGFNNLFNVRSVEVAKIDSSLFETVSLSNTDWLPPLVIESKVEPFSADADKIYTGGNHGSSGGAGGEMTARMKSIDVFIDGILALEDTLKYADSVEVKWVNELMAYNTISQKRYVLDQYFSIIITKNNIEAWSEVVANEDIVIHTDNACQMVSTNFDNIFYMNGEDMSSATPISQNSTSGSARNAPNCFAAVLKGDAKNGLQISWIDNNYGLGKDPQIGGTAAKFRRGTGTNSKIYSAAVSNRAYARNKGESYQWHGGYAWSGLDGFTGIENAFILKNSGIDHLAFATSNSRLKGTVNYPLLNAGKDVGGTRVGASERYTVDDGSPKADLVKIE